MTQQGEQDENLLKEYLLEFRVSGEKLKIFSVKA